MSNYKEKYHQKLTSIHINKCAVLLVVCLESVLYNCSLWNHRLLNVALKSPGDMQVLCYNVLVDTCINYML